jgi:flagellar biosynthesis/type III secretory pathway chaperone
MRVDGHKMTLQGEVEDRDKTDSLPLKKLLITLEQMIQKYQQLLTTLQQEKVLIIEGNLTDLSLCLIEKERLLEDLKQLEADRLVQMEPLMISAPQRGAADGSAKMAAANSSAALRPSYSLGSLRAAPIGLDSGLPLKISDDRPYRGDEIEQSARFSMPKTGPVRPVRPTPPTLRQLIDWVSAPYQARFSSCFERLRALSASVTEINQINGLLSVRILQQVNGLLGLLTHLSAIPSVYQASGFLHHDLQNGYAQRSTGSFHLRG